MIFVTLFCYTLGKIPGYIALQNENDRIFLFLFFCCLRVSPTLAGLIPEPHARTHTDRGWLTAREIDAMTSRKQAQCPNHPANTQLGENDRILFRKCELYTTNRIQRDSSLGSAQILYSQHQPWLSTYTLLPTPALACAYGGVKSILLKKRENGICLTKLTPLNLFI